MSRLDPRPGLDNNILNPLIKSAPGFIDRYFDRDPLARAKARVEGAKKQWAQLLRDREPSTRRLLEARLEFLQKAKEYTDVVDNRNRDIDTYNKANSTLPPISRLPYDSMLLQHPTLTKLDDILERHPVKKASDERFLPQLPHTEEFIKNLDIDTLDTKLVSPRGKLVAQSEDLGAALFAQEALANFKADIDKAIVTRQPVESASQIVGHLQFLIATKRSQGIFIENPSFIAWVTFNGIMLESAKKLLTDQLSTLAAGAPNATKLRAETGTRLQKQTELLGKLGFSAGTEVTLKELQEALLKLGPEDQNVKEFLKFFFPDPQRQEIILKTMGSTKDCQETEKEMDKLIDEMNKARLPTGTLGKSLKELDESEQWNKLVSRLDKNAGQYSGVAPAALAAAAYVLDEKNDITPDSKDFKDKVSARVAESAGKDDKSGIDQAAYDGALLGIEAAEKKLAETDEAENVAQIALESLDFVYKFLKLSDANILSLVEGKDDIESALNLGFALNRQFDPDTSSTLPRFIRAIPELDKLNFETKKDKEESITTITKAHFLGKFLTKVLTENRVNVYDSRIILPGLIKYFIKLKSSEKIDEAAVVEILRRSLESATPELLAGIIAVAKAVNSSVVESSIAVIKESGLAQDKLNKATVSYLTNEANLSPKLAETIKNKVLDLDDKPEKIEAKEIQAELKKEINLANTKLVAILHTKLLEPRSESKLEADSKLEVKSAPTPIVLKPQEQELLGKCLLEIANQYKAKGTLTDGELDKIITDNLESVKEWRTIEKEETQDAKSLEPEIKGNSFDSRLISVTTVSEEPGPDAKKLTKVKRTAELKALKEQIKAIGARTVVDLTVDTTIALPPNFQLISLPEGPTKTAEKMRSVFQEFQFKQVEDEVRVAWKAAGGKDTDIPAGYIIKELKAGNQEQLVKALATKNPGNPAPALAAAIVIAKTVKESEAKYDDPHKNKKNIIKKSYAANYGRSAKGIGAAMGASIEAAVIRAGIPSDVAQTLTKNILAEALKKQDEKKTSDKIKDFVTNVDRARWVNSLASDLKKLGLDEKQISPKLLAKIKEKLITDVLKSGEAFRKEQPERIIRELVNTENAKRPDDDKIRFTECTNEFKSGNDQIPAQLKTFGDDLEAVEKIEKASKKIFDAAIKGGSLAVVVQALGEVEKTYANVNKKPANYKEVTAAIVASAMASGLSKDEALKLTTSLMQTYITKGAFDDTVDFETEINRIAPHIPEEEVADEKGKKTLTQVSKIISRAAHSASHLPEDKLANGVKAGTTVAALTFPALNSPKEAGILAGAVAYVRSGKMSEVDKAGLYAEEVSTLIKPEDEPFAVASAGAVAVLRQFLDNRNGITTGRGDPTNFTNDIYTVHNELGDGATGGHIVDITDAAIEKMLSDPLLRNGLNLDNDVTFLQLTAATTISTQVGATALKLGFNQAEAKDFALALLNKESKTFLPTLETTLAIRRLGEFLDKVDNISRIPPRVSYKPNQDIEGFANRKNTALRAGLNSAGLGNIPAGDLSAEEVFRRANLAALGAKNFFLADTKVSNPAEKLAAELVGKLAALEVYRRVLDTPDLRRGISKPDLAKIAKKARSLSEEAESATADFRSQFIAKNSLAPNTIPNITPTTSREAIEKLATAGKVGSLIHIGLSEFKNSTVVDDTDKLREAVETMVINSGSTQDEARSIGEKLKQVLKTASNGEEAGALAAVLVDSAKPELSQAVGAVVADIYTDGDLQQKSKAIARASNVAALGKDRILNSAPEGVAGLEQDKQTQNKRRQAEAEYITLRDQLLRKTSDKTGYAKSLKDAHFGGLLLDLSKDKNLKITLPYYDTPQAKRLIDVMPEIAKDLKECNGYVTKETLAKAIADFNALNKPENHLELEDINGGKDWWISFEKIDGGGIQQFMEILVAHAKVEKAHKIMAETQEVSVSEAESSSSTFG